MIKKLYFIILLASAHLATAQSFEKKSTYPLPASESLFSLRWADINNDSLLDVVFSHRKEGSFTVSAYLNRLDSIWQFHDLVSVPYHDQMQLSIGHADRDHRLDLIILNSPDTAVRCFLNRDSLRFVRQNKWVDAGPLPIEIFRLIDLDNDAIPDTVLVNQNGLFISGRKDSLSMKVRSLTIHDFDKNGFKDLVWSGYDSAGNPSTQALFLGNGLRFIGSIPVAKLAGQTEAGDLNHDGLFDLVVSGQDSTGSWRTVYFHNLGDRFDSIYAAPVLGPASLRIADFNSDGIADVFLAAQDSTTQPRSFIRSYDGAEIDLPYASARDFGDFDRDGDLDVAQFVGDSLFILTNSTIAMNRGPDKPAFAFGLPVYNRTFYYWAPPGDDHTPTSSITYDLRIFNSDSVLQQVEYDSVYRSRVLVTHGNTGTANFALMKITTGGTFEVQAIDNAFVPNTKSVCSGGVSVCATIDEQPITACKETPVVLIPKQPQAMWFSLSKGFMGTGDSFNFIDAKSDTIFAFNPSVNPGCANLRVFNIRAFPTDTVRVAEKRYACEGSAVNLSVSNEWSNVLWRNNMNTTVVAAQSISPKLTADIVFKSSASNAYGCQFRGEYQFRLSEPELTLEDKYRVLKGGSVTLSVSGASTYVWAPPDFLDSPASSDPVSTPEETIEYVVKGIDSIGCVSTAKVLVEVFEKAFLPSLFTPNGDEQNDELKIYGLSQAAGFRFTIYSREGSVVYETTSIDEATRVGWSGRVGGNVQPPGTYYWKIEGKMPKGELTLNGEKSGSFLLLR